MNGEQKVIEEMAKKDGRRIWDNGEENVTVFKDDLASIIDEVSALRCKEVILKIKREEWNTSMTDHEALMLCMPLDLLTYLPKE